jgi:hypothetical protein
MAVTTAAVVGIASAVGTTAASFAQKAKQQKLSDEARAKAKQAAAEAKQKLGINYFDQLGIQKDPYIMASEAISSTAAQSIEAGRESERGAAATAGRVAMASNQGQREIAAQMGQEMQRLDMLAAQEDAANRNKLVEMDIAEIKGSNMEAFNREMAAEKAGQNAWTGIGDVLNKTAAAMPLFAKNAEINSILKLAGGKDAQQNIAKLGTVGGVDYSKVAGMDKASFEKLIYGLTPSQISELKNVVPFATNTIADIGRQSMSVPSDLKNIFMAQENPFKI